MRKYGAFFFILILFPHHVLGMKAFERFRARFVWNTRALAIAKAIRTHDDVQLEKLLPLMGNDDYYSPTEYLNYALSDGTPRAVELLLNYNKDVSVDTTMIVFNKDTKQEIEKLELLVNKFPDLLTERANSGLTLLHAAALHNKFNVANWLVSAKHVDVNIQDANGWTALNWAAYKYHLELVSFFAHHGANIDNVNDNTGLPKIHAYGSGIKEILDHARALHTAQKRRYRKHRPTKLVIRRRRSSPQ